MDHMTKKTVIRGMRHSRISGFETQMVVTLGLAPPMCRQDASNEMAIVMVLQQC